MRLMSLSQLEDEVNVTVTVGRWGHCRCYSWKLRSLSLLQLEVEVIVTVTVGS